METNELRKLQERIERLENIVNKEQFSGVQVIRKTLVLPSKNTDPDVTMKGALAVVDGKLKIYNGTTWTIVGTQV